jgi:hypothetical protein
MFYQLLAEILASLSKGPPTTKQNVYPAVHCVYSRVKSSTFRIVFLLYRAWPGTVQCPKTGV